MRIYFCGSHSTGKTTLARYVSDRWKIPMISEVARTVMAKNEKSLAEIRADIKMVNIYQETVFKNQLELEKGKTDFVSDRCGLDALAYTAEHSSILNDHFCSPETLEYTETLKKQDAVVFFVRPSKETVKADGVREELTWEGIIRIDSHVKFMLQGFRIPHIQISTANMQERVGLVEYVIGMKTEREEVEKLLK